MSRWHDRSDAGAGRWANLSLAERLSDRIADIMIAADEIRDMIAGARSLPDVGDVERAVSRIYEESSALMLRLPEPGRLPPREPELTGILDRIGCGLAEIEALRGPGYDVALGRVEQLATPYALALYFEIERLDTFLGLPRESLGTKD